jgi:hypothetical protein
MGHMAAIVRSSRFRLEKQPSVEVEESANVLQVREAPEQLLMGFIRKISTYFVYLCRYDRR